MHCNEVAHPASLPRSQRYRDVAAARGNNPSQGCAGPPPLDWPSRSRASGLPTNRRGLADVACHPIAHTPRRPRLTAGSPVPLRRRPNPPPRGGSRGFTRASPRPAGATSGTSCRSWRTSALLLAVFKVFRVEGRAFQMLVTLRAGRPAGPLPAPLSLEEAAASWRSRSPGWPGSSAPATGGDRPGALGRAPDRRLLPAGRLDGPRRDRRRARRGLALRPARVARHRRSPTIVWPVLATMFMFRMIIYLYELKHAKKPESLIDTLSYFFLLPNYCFLHFPVVDYRTFQRGYFARDVHATQRAGLQMMFRGTIHLLLYRLVYHELLIPPEEVHGPVEPGGLPRLQLPALPARLGPVPHGLRHAPPVRLPAPRDAPPLPAGDRVHRLLATDQHLLERLHGPGRVQPGRLPAEALAAARGAGGGDGWWCS